MKICICNNIPYNKTNNQLGKEGYRPLVRERSPSVGMAWDEIYDRLGRVERLLVRGNSGKKNFRKLFLSSFQLSAYSVLKEQERQEYEIECLKKSGKNTNEVLESSFQLSETDAEFEEVKNSIYYFPYIILYNNSI